MPILRSASTLYPNLFPASYSGSQVLRSGIMDGPQQKLYPAGDRGLYDHKNLNAKLRASIRTNVDLSVSLNTKDFTGQIDIGSSMGAHPPTDISGVVRVFSTVFSALPSSIGGHLPMDLNSAIRIWNRNNFMDLNGNIHGFSYDSIIAEIYMHQPVDIYGYIKSTQAAFEDLNAYLLIQLNRATTDLTTFIHLHSPENINGYIKSFINSYVDLDSYLLPILLSGTLDLQAVVEAHVPIDFTAYIKGFRYGSLNIGALLTGIKLKGYLDMTAAVAMHLPADIRAYTKCFDPGTPINLIGGLMGWDTKDLVGNISSVFKRDLSAYSYAIPPVDLYGYIKTWPQKLLYGYIMGYDTLDLSSSVNIIYDSLLTAVINSHSPVNLYSYIKGYGINELRDISGSILPLTLFDLNALLYVKQMRLLNAYLNPIPPSDIAGYIYGWQNMDLGSIISSIDSPYDIKASIYPSGAFFTINAHLKRVLGKAVKEDLASYISGWQDSDITAYISFIQPKNLNAILNVVGQIYDLGAFIQPKSIRLTTLLKIHTLMRSDLSATINLFCRNQGSSYKDLTSLLNVVYFNDIGGYLKAFKELAYNNLNATIGSKKTFVAIDKLPLNVYINNVIKAEDNFSLNLRIFMQSLNLGSQIFGEYYNYNLSAFIGGLWEETIEFDDAKSREIVYKLNRNSQVEYTRDVELLFRTKVNDYFFVSGNNKVYRTDRTEHWKTEIRSYIPSNEILKTKRKLNKFMILNDLTSFESIDEAVKMAIDYVTINPYIDLSFNLIPSGGYSNLGSVLTIKEKKTDAGNIGSYIYGDRTSVVVAYTDYMEVI